MAVSQRVSEQEYLRLALNDLDGRWELYRGELRGKPSMSAEHHDFTFELGHQLRLQIDRSEYRLRVDAPRLRRSSGDYLIPDVAVVPAALERPQRGQPGRLETYRDPPPLVVEVWSPSTGGYDVATKVPEYQARGDEEIWRLHPYERALTAWRRRADGSYEETVDLSGVVRPSSLPWVAIDLDRLFAVE